MTIMQISTWCMLVFCGLWTGGIMGYAVDRTSVWRRMPIDQYAVDFRRHLLQVDPLMPILGAIAGISAIYFALHKTGLTQTLTWIGFGIIVVVFLASVTLAEPVNSKFRRLPEGQVPERAEFYRNFWRRFHRTRCALAIIALACFAAAVSL